MAYPMRALLLIALSSLLAAFGMRDAALAYWRVQDPGQVPRAFVTDPRLKVRAAELTFSNPEQFAARAGAMAADARAALKSEPLSAIAMSQLGMAIAVQRAGAGGTQFAAAEHISRRDLATQLLLIELSAQNGDVTAALSHYDRALLVYSAASRQLYPLLARALSDPDIRAALAKYAARPWAVDFLSTAITLGGDPASVLAMMAEVRTQLPQRDAERLTTALIGQLAARGDYAALRNLVRQMPRETSRVIDDIGLSSATSDLRLAPLSWVLANETALETAFEPNGQLVISVASERSGKAASRVTLLAPGNYQLTQAVSYAASTPHAALDWEVRCLGEPSSKVIWQQQLPIAAGSTTYRSEVTVPEACEAQSWQLMATAEETQYASIARLSELSLVRR